MKNSSLIASLVPPGQQRGVVLIFTLILLVVMTLGAVALIRSVDTGNLVAGNLAFQQSATNSADVAVEEAITWINANSALLNSDQPPGYLASALNQNPVAGQTWEDFWNKTLNANAKTVTTSLADAGNTVRYIIHRQCGAAKSPTDGGNCSASPSTGVAGGNEEESGQVQLNGVSSIFYRITIQVKGPRNTASYVQVMVSL